MLTILYSILTKKKFIKEKIKIKFLLIEKQNGIRKYYIRNNYKIAEMYKRKV